jgi:peptidoglycan/LPS O-acetylase OafA/YrhL
MTHARPLHRADIDGLRAIAVALVICFHLGFAWCQGGYVGVDVFFVISGYLITKLIVKEVSASGALGFARFYERRIRRLFPALFATVILTTAVGVVILHGATLRELLSESIFGVASVSNIYFWMKSGYFDSDAVTKPLLHLWSLSVEEQFYLVWPALVVLSLRRQLAGWTIGAFAIASFAANLWLVRDGDTSTIFFLTPFRIFEFAIGAAIIWLERLDLASSLLREIGVLVGLVMIVGAGVVYSTDTVFPSSQALAPCIGAALVINFGATSAIGVVLRNPVAQYIGKISYSLYLVHWPVVVFFHLLAGRGPDATESFLLLAGLSVGGIAMYHLVEQRFRIRGDGAPRLAFSVFGAIVLALVLAFVTVVFTIRTSATAADPTIDPDAVAKAGQRYSWSAMRQLRGGFVDARPKILLVGDSQAADFLNLVLAYDPALASVIRTFSSDKFCQVRNPAFYTSGEYKDHYTPPAGQLASCDRERAAFAADDRVDGADTIILAYAWYRSAARYLPEELAAIRTRNPRARVFVVGRKDQPRSSLDYLDDGVSVDAASVAAVRDALAEVREVNASLASQTGATFLDLYAVFCDGGRCEIFTESGYPVLFEARHLTPIGAAFVARGVRFYKLVAVPLGLAKEAR